MLLKLTYWAVIGLLGMVHTYFFCIHFSLSTIYGSIFFIGCLTLLLFKISFNFLILGKKINHLLFILQLLLLMLYYQSLSGITQIVVLLLFMGIEWLRFTLSRKTSIILENSNQLLEQYHQLNDTFRIVRQERHDFLKHVSSVHFMIENEKIEDARTYLEEMVGGYKQTNLSIKGERGAVAGILHSMYKKAQANDIELIYDFDLPLSTLPLSDKEMVGLIGNLLSNSIEASVDWKQARQTQTQITLQFYKRSGLFLIICKNKTLPIPNAILDELYLTYGKTTKKEGHEGLGTKIVYDIVSDHLGFLDFICKDEEFLVKIKIPSIR